MIEDMKIVDQFIQLTSEKNQVIAKYFYNNKTDEQSKLDLLQVFNFLMKEKKYTVEQIAEAYVFFNSMMLEEQYYFMINHEYRNKSFDDVNKYIYQNKEYMEKYMTGLAVSDYIWVNHKLMLQWFKEFLDERQELKNLSGDYIEIGPGYGQFMVKAIQSELFDCCMGIDISEDSARTCEKFMSYIGIRPEKYRIICDDFYNYNINTTIKAICMCEVLEHLENPNKMMEKVYDCLIPNGVAYITTPVNTPMIDHISLFRNESEVIKLATDAGFECLKYHVITPNNVSVEKAQKKKMAMNIVMELKKY